MVTAPETPAELRECAAEYARCVDLPVDCEAIDWSVTERAQRRAGVCRYDPAGRTVTIELAWPACRDAGWDRVRGTIRHELVHAWEFRRYGRSDHGDRFALMARTIDAPIDRDCAVRGRIELACRRCSWSDPRFRASRPVRRPAEYACPDCGGALGVAHRAGPTWRTAVGYRIARQRLDDRW
ncbi:MAG: SprT-like domain-containing protein [Halococcoides sp.]